MLKTKKGDIKKNTEDNAGVQQQLAAKLTRKQVIRLIISVAITLIILAETVLMYSSVNDGVFVGILTAIVAVISLAILGIVKKFETLYKIMLTVMYVAVLSLTIMLSLHYAGILDKINSTQKLIEYINNSGGVAEIVFILIQLLQVTVIPIPSSITTTAGAIMFQGIWKPLVLTVTGLVLGSMLAFFLGRVFGSKFANWLVGEDAMKKYYNMTKGRDKIILFYMFIFPFFPDDLLCVLAGMTTYTYGGFFILQIVTRTIGTLSTILVTKGIVNIPLSGWWLLLWAAIVVGVILLLILTVKNSEKLEKGLIKIISKVSKAIGLKKLHEKLGKVAETEAEKKPDSNSSVSYESIDSTEYSVEVSDEREKSPQKDNKNGGGGRL